MQTNTTAAPRKGYGANQEWGAKARKNEAKNMRSTARRAAIADQKESN